MNQPKSHDSFVRNDVLGSRCSSREQIEVVADRVARSRISVLILGETGVGKEVLAQRIHSHSPRAERPIVSIDCAALCPTLIESQLFGHERGAFTGAAQSKPGLFEAADGGTLFLDEVGELPLAAQVKLLRVLETRTIQRVGSTKSHPIDVRFLAATNRDLDREVKNGNFRADLLFRLDGMRLTLPPLRDRIREIPDLAAGFLAEASAREGIALPSLSPGAIKALLDYSWPGNIRELRNVVERALALCESGTIESEHLMLDQSDRRDQFDRQDETMDRPEPVPERTTMDRPATGGPYHRSREAIVAALEQCAGNQSRAAALLGISRRTLVARITSFDLPRPRQSGGARTSVDRAKPRFVGSSQWRPGESTDPAFVPNRVTTSTLLSRN